MANFCLKIAILMRGDRQEWRIFRLKIAILARVDRQEWRILGLR